MNEQAYPRLAEVGRHSWAGLRWVTVEVVGETPKRYRVRWPSGVVTLVPKGAVRFAEPRPLANHGS